MAGVNAGRVHLCRNTVWSHTAGDAR